MELYDYSSFIRIKIRGSDGLISSPLSNFKLDGKHLNNIEMIILRFPKKSQKLTIYVTKSTIVSKRYFGLYNGPNFIGQFYLDEGCSIEAKELKVLIDKTISEFIEETISIRDDIKYVMDKECI